MGSPRGGISIPISQMRRLYLRELKFLASVKKQVGILEVFTTRTGYDSGIGLCLG